MGVYLRVPNWDEDFSRLQFQPVILNRDWSDVDEKTDVVTSLMVTKFDQAFVDIEPTCSCGATTGRHNLHCDKCDTPVMSIFDHKFASDVWLQAPTGFPSLILPNFLSMLMRAFKKSRDRFNAIEYLMNPAYRVPDMRDEAYQAFLELNIPRGFVYFTENFDDILAKIIESRIFGGNTNNIRKIKRFVEENRHLLFPRYMPLPSKHSIITEKSTSGVIETNRSMLTIVDAARVFFALENADRYLSARAKESRVFNAMKSIIAYREYVDRKIISRKPGWFRKQVFGTRIGPSGRAVISSLTGIHRYNGVRPPIGIGLVCYFPEISGELMRRGRTANQAAQEIYGALTTPNREIYDILNKEFPSACTYSPEGLPVIMGRAPVLDKRSIQALHTEYFKEDLDDSTIGLPIDVTRAYNADFDGDQMAVRPSKSAQDWEQIKVMSPESGLVDFNHPNAHNDNMGLCVPIITTLNEIIYGE